MTPVLPNDARVLVHSSLTAEMMGGNRHTSVVTAVERKRLDDSTVSTRRPFENEPSSGSRQMWAFVTARRRGQRLYDWWSRHERTFGLLYDLAFLGGEQSFRDRSVEALALRAGDSVVEFGCGPGNSFAALRERVGETGRVVGVDYSAGMVERAKSRVRQEGWENVDVVRGDATRLGIKPKSFDAVYAAMSLTAMPDPDAAIREAFTVLQNGGRIAVLDAQPFQTFPWTVLNSLIVPISKWATNWNVDTDVQMALQETFGSISISETNGGTIFIVRGLKQRDDPTSTDRE